jgi:hypothetical protein
VRFITRAGFAVILAAAMATGCGDTKARSLTRDDLSGISRVQPTTAGWNWPTKPTREPQGDCTGWRWQDEDKLGVTTACLFDSASAARRGLPRARAFARVWIKRTVGGALFTDVRLQGLGDDAWRIQGNFSNGQQVTYGWRRDALMLQVHIQCIFQRCPSAILPAARTWVDAIDEEARKRL